MWAVMTAVKKPAVVDAPTALEVNTPHPSGHNTPYGTPYGRKYEVAEGADAVLEGTYTLDAAGVDMHGATGTDQFTPRLGDTQLAKHSPHVVPKVFSKPPIKRDSTTHMHDSTYYF